MAMCELKRPASERGARGRGTQGETSRKKNVWFPAWAAGRRPDRFTLLLAAAAALGAGLVSLRLASYGPGMLADGPGYILAARNFLADDRIVGYLVLKPPLYPAMLAGGGLFGLGPYAVAGPLNAVLFGLTVLVAGWWLRGHLQSRFLWLWGCFSIALALPLTEIASHALSESAFILFVTLALTQIDAHLRGGGRASLILAAAFSALACLTRYMGVSVILAVVPLLLAARVTPREKMKRIAVYTLIAAAPVGLWMLRNVLVAGSMTGERAQGFYSFDFIVDESLRIAVRDWWLVGLTAPALLALVMAACHAFSHRSDWKRDAAVASDVAWGPLRVFGGFALAYLTLLVYGLMSGKTWYGLEWRYLTPVYVPLLLTALLLMDGALRYARKRAPRGIVPRQRGVPAIGGGLLEAALMLALSLQVAWLVALHGRAIPLWNAGEQQGVGGPRWRNSESMQYIREAALTGKILSNAYNVMRLYDPGPERQYALPCKPDRLQSALWNARSTGEVHVLYFSERDGRRGCSRQEEDDLRNALSREPLLELVVELADGKLYRLRELEEHPPAMFYHSDVPVEGKSFAAFFNKSHGRRLPGELWRWEKSDDADGWTSLPVQRSTTDMYTPTAADVGHRLRASVYYADQLGNRVRATTKPSEPVQAGASEADRIIRSRYEVSLRGNRLTYENRSCRWGDEQFTRFLLAVYSLDSESGTPERDTLDFYWSESSWQGNGTCIAERRLPDKDIVGIRTGQVDRDGNPLWEAEHWFEEKGRWLATAGEPAARSVFDIYLGEGSLSFVKEPCARADTEAMFFLHLIPADVDDLPEERKQYGFGGFNFDFGNYPLIKRGFCVATRELPDYAIATIRTGQFIGEGKNIWEVSFDVVEPVGDGQAVP